MKYLFGLLLLSIFICCKHQPSTSEQEFQKPDSLISREKMIRILTDVHLAEAAIVYLKNKGDQTKNLTEDYYSAVFSKYKISKETFTSNFNYYKQDEQDFMKMYEEVIRKLESMKTTARSKK
jgi:hypothetical protein